MINGRNNPKRMRNSELIRCFFPSMLIPRMKSAGPNNVIPSGRTVTSNPMLSPVQKLLASLRSKKNTNVAPSANNIVSIPEPDAHTKCHSKIMSNPNTILPLLVSGKSNWKICWLLEWIHKKGNNCAMVKTAITCFCFAFRNFKWSLLLVVSGR